MNYVVDQYMSEGSLGLLYIFYPITSFQRGRDQKSVSYICFPLSIRDFIFLYTAVVVHKWPESNEQTDHLQQVKLVSLRIMCFLIKLIIFSQ